MLKKKKNLTNTDVQNLKQSKNYAKKKNPKVLNVLDKIPSTKKCFSSMQEAVNYHLALESAPPQVAPSSRARTSAPFSTTSLLDDV